ncbi:MAG: PilT protein domain-containing protein [Parcubacteria group bacterium Greene0714_21]|nr:MAG: PilT protein domain-containing protein [Parcubacteria group bacterium Greene0416_39]TSC98337.1 MAG: PilT protein domain-containing protein [Parcubacteria group bacterium Greene1014_47]TSD03987.1 MAG: PilT protein domain-containing protein [Parcubacteria group bacterium Greene0714_21]
MKSTPKLFSVFLDTSVLLSGLNSQFGASGIILSLFKLGKIKSCISPEVLEETDRVIQTKLPLLVNPFLSFLMSKPMITARVTQKEMQSAYKILQTEDSPILAGFLKSRAHYLLTLDKKFQKLTRERIEGQVITPGEFLELYRS